MIDDTLHFVNLYHEFILHFINYRIAFSASCRLRETTVLMVFDTLYQKSFRILKKSHHRMFCTSLGLGRGSIEKTLKDDKKIQLSLDQKKLAKHEFGGSSTDNR